MDSIVEEELIKKYGTVNANIDEIKDNLSKCSVYGFNLLFVDANSEKGYNYPYILGYKNTNKLGTTLFMDCLNDYENEMDMDKTENKKVQDEIYNLFGKDRLSNEEDNKEEKQEESETESMYRLSYRLKKATNHMTNLFKVFSNAPILIPLIPGYGNRKIEGNESELGEGVAKKIVSDIIAIIEDAKGVLEERTGLKMQDKIFNFGYSKSAVFANNFSVLAPEQCENIMIRRRRIFNSTCRLYTT